MSSRLSCPPPTTTHTSTNAPRPPTPHPSTTQTLVKALILLRNRQQLAPTELLPLLFKLFRVQASALARVRVRSQPRSLNPSSHPPTHPPRPPPLVRQDKALRQLVFRHITADIKNSNRRHRNERLNRALQNFMYRRASERGVGWWMPGWVGGPLLLLPHPTTPTHPPTHPPQAACWRTSTRAPPKRGWRC